MFSQRGHSWLSLYTVFLFNMFLVSVIAQNTTNTTAAPYASYTDKVVYSDGTGVDPSKNLDNPTIIAINVPEGAGRSDLFVHFSAPAENFAWAGFGFGSGMKNSLMFVVYRSENNTNNITVSPRLGQGHVTPQLTSDVSYNILDLSGVDTNNRFVLNMQCFNCRSWQSGKLTISDGSQTQPIFYAMGPQTNFASDDPSASISQHSRNMGPINLYLTPGTPGLPIVEDDPSEPRYVPGQNGTNNSNDGTYQPTRYSLAIHAVFMCFAFSIVFPGGYLLLKLFDIMWLHWIPQTIGVLCVIAGAAAGIHGAHKYDLGFTHPHQIFGFIIVMVMLGTWTLGLIGHRIYKKTETPSPLIKLHRIVGPLVIISGVANAFIGYAWIGSLHIAVIYAIFTFFVVVVISTLLFWKMKHEKKKAALNSVAASNFREGNEYGLGHGPAVYYGNQPPPVPSFTPQAGNGVQMQTFYPKQ